MDGIPPPLNDDDDDVAWALQTAAVQWQRDARADAVVWLRRAVDAAISAGNAGRAHELTVAADALTEQLILGAAPAPAPPAPGPAPDEDVDSLLDVDVRLSLPLGIESDPSPVLIEPSEPPARRPPAPPPPPPRPGLPPVRPPPPPRPGAPGAPIAPARPAATPAPLAAPVASAPPPAFPPVPSSHAPSERPPRVSSVPPHAPSSHPAPAVRSSRPPSAAQSSHPPPSALPLPALPMPLSAAPPLAVEQAASARDAPLPSYADEELGDLAASSRDAPLPSYVDEELGDLASSAPLPSYADEDLGAGSAAAALAEAPPPMPPEPEPEPAPAPARASSKPAPAPPAEPQPAAQLSEPIVDGVSLADARGLQDLPEDAQLRLAAQAKIEEIRSDEEVSGFAVALVTSGDVRIMPAIADAACAAARKGDVVFTVGSLAEGILLRVVAGPEGARVAVWQAQALEEATAPCPWVADELRLVADRYQALAGAVMGAMGDRLDDTLRQMVTDRCQVRLLLGREVLLEAGQAVDGLYIVGAGRIELLEGSEDGDVADELGPGDFLFAEQVLHAGAAPATARAGKTGALLLYAPRMTAHELLVSVPPLLEILAG